MKNIIRLLLCGILAFTACFSIDACQAITSKGTVCKRSGEPYCWQHAHLANVKTTSSSSSSSSSVSSYSTADSSSKKSSSSSSYTEPNSYKVYKQRKEQGSRNFSQSTRKKKYQECGGRCAHCGGYFELSEMDADHIVPYSKGGKTEESNCQMLCKHCNRSKGNRSCK